MIGQALDIPLDPHARVSFETAARVALRSVSFRSISPSLRSELWDFKARQTKYEDTTRL